MVMGIGLNTSSRDGNISRSVEHAENAGTARATARQRYVTDSM
jgi:hypothetical protein